MDEAVSHEPPLMQIIELNRLHEGHPSIRAEDWRSPLVHRLLRGSGYADGSKNVQDSYKAKGGTPAKGSLLLEWKDLKEDYERCINTYQEPILTEFATLALACILVEKRAGLEITEVTRRGEKVDYWLGDRELLLEVSGMQSGDLESLCTAKADGQLRKNPFGLDGYVCVAEYSVPRARLWYYESES